MEELINWLMQMERQQRELVSASRQQAGAVAEQIRRSELAEAGLHAGAGQVAASQTAIAQVPLARVQAVKSTVDTRPSTSRKSFSGRREGWKEFRFLFEACACAAHPSLTALFRTAESMKRGDNQPLQASVLHDGDADVRRRSSSVGHRR